VSDSNLKFTCFVCVRACVESIFLKMPIHNPSDHLFFVFLLFHKDWSRKNIRLTRGSLYLDKEKIHKESRMKLFSN